MKNLINKIIKLFNWKRSLNVLKNIFKHIKSRFTKPQAKKTKIEEPKVEETKVEKTKVEEAKVEKPKVEETKVEKTKVEEAKVEKPKVEETKVEETKVAETKVEEPKVAETKVEKPKVEETKVEFQERYNKRQELKLEDLSTFTTQTKSMILEVSKALKEIQNNNNLNTQNSGKQSYKPIIKTVITLKNSIEVIQRCKNMLQLSHDKQITIFTTDDIEDKQNMILSHTNTDEILDNIHEDIRFVLKQCKCLISDMQKLSDNVNEKENNIGTEIHNAYDALCVYTKDIEKDVIPSIDNAVILTTPSVS